MGYAVNDLSLTLGRIEFQQIVIEDVSLGATLGAGDAVALVIHAATVSIASVPLLEQFEVHCAEGHLTGMQLRCDAGTWHARHPDQGELGGRLALQYSLDGRAGSLTLTELALGTGTIGGSLEFATGGWNARVQGRHLDLPSLRKLADRFGIWPADYSGEAGSVDITLGVHANREGIQALDGRLQTQTVSFYGTHAAEALSGEIHFEARAAEGWQAMIDGELAGGALFLDTGIDVGGIRPGIAFEVTDEPLRFSIDTGLNRDRQQIDLRRLHIIQPDMMTATLQLAADWRDGVTIHGAGLELSVQDAGQFYTTYLQPFLLNTQFNNLDMTGSFTTTASLDTTGITGLDMQITDLHAYDKNGRYSIAGLNGALRITDASTPEISSLGWTGAGLYRLVFGAGKLVLESREQTVSVVSWDDVPVLDGQLQIDTLNIINPGEADMTITLDGALSPVSMQDFTAAMGWPIMSGELTAAIDGLSYSQGRLVVGGRINLGLFDGNVYISNLRIENLFGLVPVLYADIDVDRLDLELLTNRFTFGQIQGSLSGWVHKLELQAWQPVYFEAELATPDDDKVRHRISQKAVENLGYLGGGAGGALSNGFLRMFKNYSYGRMGISCRLYNGSCELGGVGSSPDGFVIVSRGGLLPPWIEVKGTGHTIRWQTLIEGLKTITTNRPEIE